jgi:hypothetical protein
MEDPSTEVQEVGPHDGQSSRAEGLFIKRGISRKVLVRVLAGDVPISLLKFRNEAALQCRRLIRSSIDESYTGLVSLKAQPELKARNRFRSSTVCPSRLWSCLKFRANLLDFRSDPGANFCRHSGSNRCLILICLL